MISRLLSSLFSFFGFSGLFKFLTSFSTSRTLSFSSNIFCAIVYCCSGSSIEINALACPVDNISSIIICCTSSHNFKRRIELVTAVLLLDTLSATSSCFRLNSVKSLLYACASSIGFKSSR